LESSVSPSPTITPVWSRLVLQVHRSFLGRYPDRDPPPSSPPVPPGIVCLHYNLLCVNRPGSAKQSHPLVQCMALENVVVMTFLLLKFPLSPLCGLPRIFFRRTPFPLSTLSVIRSSLIDFPIAKDSSKVLFFAPCFSFAVLIQIHRAFLQPLLGITTILPPLMSSVALRAQDLANESPFRLCSDGLLFFTSLLTSPADGAFGFPLTYLSLATRRVPSGSILS